MTADTIKPQRDARRRAEAEAAAFWHACGLDEHRPSLRRQHREAALLEQFLAWLEAPEAPKEGP